MVRRNEKNTDTVFSNLSKEQRIMKENIEREMDTKFFDTNTMIHGVKEWVSRQEETKEVKNWVTNIFNSLDKRLMSQIVGLKKDFPVMLLN